MVQTLIQATGSNRSSEARDGKARGRAFITLLFAVIALFLLPEHLGNGDYETRLYAYQGAIVEEYTRAGTAFTPEKAREIVRSSTFDFTYTDGLLTVHTDQGSTSVALRSVRGGA